MTDPVMTAIDTLLKETLTNGGSTVSVTGALPPVSGFMVGGVTEPMTTDANLLEPDRHDVLYPMILRFVSSHYKTLTKGNTFLGGWIDTESHTFYLDISERFNVKEMATIIAGDRKEIAIWDVKEAKEIRIKVEGDK